MDLKEIGWEGVNWIQWLKYEPVVGSCEHDHKPLGSIKRREILGNLNNYYILRWPLFCGIS
jgi:hypothetical protein